MKYARIGGVIAVITALLAAFFLCYKENGNWGWFLFLAAILALIVYEE